MAAKATAVYGHQWQVEAPNLMDFAVIPVPLQKSWFAVATVVDNKPVWLYQVNNSIEPDLFGVGCL
ncbi:MAG: hypothetical protein U0T73_09190 [Chitinophagales bacterium]